MRAAEMKQVPQTHIGVMVVTIGVLVALLSGLITFTLVSDDATNPPQSARMVSFVDSSRFMELNTQLPEYAGNPVLSSVQNRFLEMNTQLPEYSGSRMHSPGTAQNYK